VILNKSCADIPAALPTRLVAEALPHNEPAISSIIKGVADDRAVRYPSCLHSGPSDVPENSILDSQRLIKASNPSHSWADRGNGWSNDFTVLWRQSAACHDCLCHLTGAELIACRWHVRERRRPSLIGFLSGETKAALNQAPALAFAARSHGI